LVLAKRTFRRESMCAATSRIRATKCQALKTVSEQHQQDQENYQEDAEQDLGDVCRSRDAVKPIVAKRYVKRFLEMEPVPGPRLDSFASRSSPFG
jgi:hypothetical protein